MKDINLNLPMTVIILISDCFEGFILQADYAGIIFPIIPEWEVSRMHNVQLWRHLAGFRRVHPPTWLPYLADKVSTWLHLSSPSYLRPPSLALGVGALETKSDTSWLKNTHETINFYEMWWYQLAINNLRI